MHSVAISKLNLAEYTLKKNKEKKALLSKSKKLAVLVVSNYYFFNISHHIIYLWLYKEERKCFI